MTYFPRRFFVAMPVALLAGCLFDGGGDSGSDPPAAELPPPEGPPAEVLRPMRAYITGVGADLTAFDLDPATGVLTAIGAPTASGSNPMQIVVDPSGRFAYVAAYDDRAVRSYDLRTASGVPEFTGDSAAVVRVRSVSVHPSGKFVYATDQDNNRVAQFTAHPDTGVLGDNGFADVGGSPYSIVIHPAGLFAYVANVDGDSINVYGIDGTTGVLSEIPENLVNLPPSAANPFHLAFDPAGKFLYLGSSAAGAETVSAYAVDGATGVLTPVGAPLNIGGQNPHGLAVHPSGRFVYVAVNLGNVVTAYEMANNAFSLVGSFEVGAGPSAVAVDVSGKFLYVTCEGDDTVSIFAIDAATGALTSTGAPVALPENYAPLSIAIVEKK